MYIEIDNDYRYKLLYIYHKVFYTITNVNNMQMTACMKSVYKFVFIISKIVAS